MEPFKVQYSRYYSRECVHGGRMVGTGFDLETCWPKFCTVPYCRKKLPLYYKRHFYVTVPFLFPIVKLFVRSYRTYKIFFLIFGKEIF
jgi:hypothetical protein